MTDIAGFILGDKPDSLGRHIDQFFAYNHFWLEHDHKYIQVLFPIDQGTKFNRHAPLVTDDVRAQFANDPQLPIAHLRALDLMLEFWGLTRDGETISSPYPLSATHHVWLKNQDHNQLRITRAIRSLALLGNKTIAENLAHFVISQSQENASVSELTHQYWLQALDV
ncbi:hypothetical protein VII00023_09254 [Vibrio ichthyoenteri ATCC 700023]|uniref:Opioid growth factor receptor (OGFr) conserved domain-containing protein n=1 Tax=Vibrio ichthyoenteri ATCC 700023 TaxID=870968 RepID=F9S8V0_9VIBR|nr:opioid growth factor receptor-related protein [Vibrio ichthyoenteri]EGU29587.1 hypothetical protein VII00023_09254 [Vibrio ichthyoenteri ATCC 700023]